MLVGNVSFSMTIGMPVSSDQVITMTATDPFGNTSEFSAPSPVGMSGATETVTTTADTGAGSFRRAIELTNAYPGPNVIAFNIPGTGPHAIRPASPLPVITDTLLIDGYTQPGSTANSNTIADGSNAVLKIEIDGSSAGAETPGLVIAASQSVVRGVVVNRFTNAGIAVLGNYDCVEGCFVGTDATGTARLGNSSGVVVAGSAMQATVGSMRREGRNIISGNTTAGVIFHDGAMAGWVLGNLIGTNAAGSASLGNTQVGIALLACNGVLIGGGNSEGRNIIGGSGSDGQNGAPVVRGAGILVAEDAWLISICNNIIGLNAAGDAALENYMDGILARARCYIGSYTDSLPPGVISGNTFCGVRVANVRGGACRSVNPNRKDEYWDGYHRESGNRQPNGNHGFGRRMRMDWQ